MTTTSIAETPGSVFGSASTTVRRDCASLKHCIWITSFIDRSSSSSARGPQSTGMRSGSTPERGKYREEQESSAGSSDGDVLVCSLDSVNADRIRHYPKTRTAREER